MSIPAEVLQSLTTVFTNALKAAVQEVSAAAAGGANAAQEGGSKPAAFAIGEFKTSDGSSVEDYFKRFDWALNLSRIREADHAAYARVHMGIELNNALKFLVSPRQPEDLTYAAIKTTLVEHFDRPKNKYAESIKFRQLRQEPEESIASFALRLRQTAAHCEYGDFLDRMLIEQLLFGLESRGMCDEIIAKNPETFDTAYKVAHTIEATHKTSVEVTTDPAGTTITTNKLGYVSTGVKKGSFRQGSSNQDRAPTCHGCGGRHERKYCKFRDAVCFACNRKEHLSKVCRSKTAQVKEELSPLSDEGSDYADHTEALQKVDVISSVEPLDRKMLEVQIDGKAVKMELDTGAPCAIVSLCTLRKIKASFRLHKSERQFASYTRHRIHCIGRLPVNVTLENGLRNLHTTLTLCSCLARLSHLISRFDGVFGETAGKLAGPPASLHLKPGASPVFSNAREIPFALRDAYAREIDKKISSGLYKRVESSEWASTTHVVAKKNGTIRITDYLFHKMKGAAVFCHLDITDAYSHLTVDDDFGHALTLNTPTHGLIRPTRAVYGAANIPAIWQRRMETVLQGLSNVVNFYDDILIHAASFEEMLDVLEKTLEWLRTNGLRLNRSKCVFGAPAVEFLGHKIDAAGVHKSDRHIEAIRDAKKPSSPEELQLFLGKATYYSTFIPNLSTRDRILRDMLLHDNFKWTASAETAYAEIKSALISPQVLMQYDPELPLLLATDASSTGLGVVLSHRLSDGVERPIAYASRTLSTTEQRYPQMDKEALAIVWAVQKFFMYLYAHHWTLITDHKPLSQILHPEKSLPTLCISRMANYAVFLGNFDFDVVFKRTKENVNADYCSRVVPGCGVNLLREMTIGRDEQFDAFDCFMLHQIQQLPIHAQRIAQETRRDDVLGKILRALEEGQSLERVGFKSPEINYKTAAGCLVYEHRVVVPRSLQEAVLKDLHVGHLGIVKMKGLARSFIYWPGIDADIERAAKECHECAKNANDPPKFRDHVWEYPKAPWGRIHIDYAGPYLGVMLLIITDAYSGLQEQPTSPQVSTNSGGEQFTTPSITRDASGVVTPPAAPRRSTRARKPRIIFSSDGR
ncbi:uncharacterized protein LOC135698874 [Ochlerotatus camptorhynchus]|uniref:uncharacterized protein LOC135698874 n=1 Tax=Ochlerotatus camptorhynchus TaxID=644619 RepID=UPI0031D7C4CE